MARFCFVLLFATAAIAEDWSPEKYEPKEIKKAHVQYTSSNRKLVDTEYSSSGYQNFRCHAEFLEDQVSGLQSAYIA
jgi:hypothetical protein